VPGRLPDAIEAFRNSVRIAPERADGRRNLAIALSQAGDWAGTVEHYSALLVIDPRDPQDHLNMARALMAIEDDSPRAMAEVRAALALNPALPYAHELMGRLLVPTNRVAAIEEFRTAIRLKADAADAHLHLGDLLAMDPASLDEALAEYRTALALRPDSFDAAYNAGTLLLGVPGETPAAIAALTTAVSVSPGDPRAHTNLAVALVDAGRTHDAMAHLEMAVRLAPDLPAPRALLARLQGR
jgi:tetratricopeptide (TPR) repeat protein